MITGLVMVTMVTATSHGRWAYVTILCKFNSYLIFMHPSIIYATYAHINSIQNDPRRLKFSCCEATELTAAPACRLPTLIHLYLIFRIKMINAFH